MYILLDKDIILADVKMNYNGSISQTSHVKDSKYIFKEIKLYYLGWPIGGHPCELWKIKCMRAHIHTHTHACKDTRMHASIQQ